VPTGGRHTYAWEVPERAGPTAHEGSSAFWMYHSHTDEIRDVASGLIGAPLANPAARAAGPRSLVGGLDELTITAARSCAPTGQFRQRPAGGSGGRSLPFSGSSA
jgi:hypothetical protein